MSVIRGLQYCGADWCCKKKRKRRNRNTTANLGGGYTGEPLPYVTSNSGQIIHGSDSNGDANSCVFSSAVLSMSSVNPNQISVMVALHSINVVYTVKYEILDCIGLTYNN